MKDLERTLNALLSEALEEDALENEPAVEKAEEAGHEDGRVEATPVDDMDTGIIKPAADSADAVVSVELERKPEVELEKKPEAEMPSVEDSKEEINKALLGTSSEASPSVVESVDRINALLDQINEELDLPDGKIENKDITDDTANRSDVYPEDEDLEKKDVEDVDVDNEDIYDDEMEKKSDDVEGIVQENQMLFRILEDAGILSVEKSENLADVVDDDHYDEGNELVDDSELERKDVYPEDEDLEKKDIEEVNIDNEDIYNSETEVADEEVDSEVVNEALAMLSEMNYDEVCVFLESNGIEASDENIDILESKLNEWFGFANKWDRMEKKANKIHYGSIDKATTEELRKIHADPTKTQDEKNTEGAALTKKIIDNKNAWMHASARHGGFFGRGAKKAVEAQVERERDDMVNQRMAEDDKKRDARAKTRMDNRNKERVEDEKLRHEKEMQNKRFEMHHLTGDDKKSGIKDGDTNRAGNRRYTDVDNTGTHTGKFRLQKLKRSFFRPWKKSWQDVKENNDISIEDMLQILESNGYESSLENLNVLSEALDDGYYSLVLTEEDEVKIVPTNPEDEQYDIDEEIEDDFKNEESEVKPEDLHEEDDVKPEDLVSHEKEETPEGGEADQNLEIAGNSEENEEDPTVKLPVDTDPSDSEVKPEDLVVKESVQYTSIKEACMLDEGYFYEDTFLRETAEAKQNRLVEQVTLIMAREAADPLYEEILKSAAYLSRLQEACKKKYGNKARTESKKIIGEPKETLSENFI